jgi:hypothetical protein
MGSSLIRQSSIFWKTIRKFRARPLPSGCARGVTRHPRQVKPPEGIHKPHHLPHTLGKGARFLVWTADSIDRDFRNDKWSSQELDITPGSAQASAAIAMPQEGYRAYLVEARLSLPTGETYKLSTEARVIPDNIE